MPIWEMVEASVLASAVRDSLVLTATLSAVHVVGFTLIVGSALFVNLRCMGLLLADRPRTEVVVPGTRALMLGLAISVPSGVLSFLPRAIAVSGNSTFLLKMLLLATAVCLQSVTGRLAQYDELSLTAMRAMGAASLLAWLALGLTACAFILLE